jgi:hypothetical protein
MLVISGVLECKLNHFQARGGVVTYMYMYMNGSMTVAILTVGDMCSFMSKCKPSYWWWWWWWWWGGGYKLILYASVSWLSLILDRAIGKYAKCAWSSLCLCVDEIWSN